MTIQQAQQDNRLAYVGGGPGVFISGVFWICAALMLRTKGTTTAFAFLFFSGMLTFPLAQLASRLVFHRPAASKVNPVGRVALESTIAMIAGFVAPWLLLTTRPTYVFPLMAIAVGTHYAAFRTVYGNALFWILAGLITVVSVCDLLGDLRLPGGTPLAVGIIEIVLGTTLAIRDNPSSRETER